MIQSGENSSSPFPAIIRYSTSIIYTVAFSPDNTLLAASSHEAIRLWDMKRRRPVGGKLCGHIAHLWELASK
jgi:WD40 repeat protein